MSDRRNRCKYFNGISHNLCRAGECYEKHDVHQCIGEETADCPKYERYSEEEIKEQEEHRNKIIDKTIIARAEIVKALNGKQGSGKMSCPICKTGILYYIMAGNGHISASCTKHCVLWME